MAAAELVRRGAGRVPTLHLSRLCLSERAGTRWGAPVAPQPQWPVALEMAFYREASRWKKIMNVF